MIISNRGIKGPHSSDPDLLWARELWQIALPQSTQNVMEMELE
jgi:hypothetical protein